jgi:hypothetical protein
METDLGWTVWGDAAAPILDGTEQECRIRATRLVNEGRQDVYIQDPQGNEYEWQEGTRRWLKT